MTGLQAVSILVPVGCLVYSAWRLVRSKRGYPGMTWGGLLVLAWLCITSVILACVEYYRI